MVINVRCLLKIQRMLHVDETHHAFHVWYVFIGWFNYRTTMSALRRRGVTIYERAFHPSNIKSWLPYICCRFKQSWIDQFGVFQANSDVKSTLKKFKTLEKKQQQPLGSILLQRFYDGCMRGTLILGVDSSYHVCTNMSVRRGIIWRIYVHSVH